MKPSAFLSSSRALAVVGKGGVGRTAIAVSLGRLAAQEGMRALYVDIEGRGDGAKYFDNADLTYTERLLFSKGSGELWGRVLSPDAALSDWLDDHGLRRVSAKMSNSGVIDIVAAGVPGIRDLLILGKIKQLERENAFDVVIVDCSASGHSIDLFATPYALQKATPVGPIRSQANDVVEMLGDRRRFSVLMAAIAEDTPVREALETMDALRSKTSAHIAGVIVNQRVVISDELRHAQMQLRRADVSKIDDISALDRLLRVISYTIDIGDSQEQELHSFYEQRRLPIANVPMFNAASLKELVIEISQSLAGEVERW